MTQMPRETVWKLRIGFNTGHHRSAERTNRLHCERFALPNNARSAPHGEGPDSLWKGYSRNFALTEFSEAGHCLLAPFDTTADTTQGATRSNHVRP